MPFLRRVPTLLLAGLLTTAFACAFAPAGAMAAAGELDTTFGASGLASSAVLPNMSGGAGEVIALPDGKTLAFGSVQFFSGVPDIAVARFNENGSPDTSFSGDGLVTITIPGASYASSVHGGVQPSGKVIVTAQADIGAPDATTNYEFVVIRLNDNGTLDDTFDGEGPPGNGIVRQIVSGVGPPVAVRSRVGFDRGAERKNLDGRRGVLERTGRPKPTNRDGPLQLRRHARRQLRH